MTDSRPDPDALLARIQADEQRERRGRLRIYFGASAGVGKTYAMLVAARAQQQAGRAVLAGVVETHGRSETAELLEGLPTLPLARMDHRGRTLAEFDLDGALDRRPALILVDELAHSNAPGSRHPKRWQDVDELLGAGIDVWTTLNVQHLESLNDVVGGITGIVVHETLPDTFFDRADEVVVVDTPADELIARLAAGKVYLAEQAERAIQHFFRKGNLMALRELALRRTADRVGDDVIAYRTNRAIGNVWKTEGGLLCCIGPHDGAEHVVRSAARLAQQLAVSWHAVYVETPALQRLEAAKRQRILQTVKLAETLGATTAVVPAQDVAAALVGQARTLNLSMMLLGRRHTEHSSSSAAPAFTLLRPVFELWSPRVSTKVARLAPEIDRIEVGQPARSRAPMAPTILPVSRTADRPESRRQTGYGLALVISIGTTLISWPLAGRLDIANIVMLYLLAVVGVALWFGRGPAILAAVVNVGLFDFLFVDPRLSFSVSDVQYLVTFAVMLIVGLVVGQLTAGLRFQARVATHREARSRALFGAARDLSATLSIDQAIRAAQQAIGQEFHAAVAIYWLDDDGQLVAPADMPAKLDAGTARWVLDHDQPAGLGTDTLPASPWLYLPLKTSQRARGVVALQPEQPRFLLVPEQRQQLETFTVLTAMALERVHYSDVARNATVQIESERLRNSLLSALSHDLRTPLAALVGLAESLKLTPPPLASAQLEVVDGISEKALGMTQLVTNLLDMARLQSGEIRLRIEWQSLEELVGAALSGQRAALGERPIRTVIDPAAALVDCDAVLIERVFANLLENAAKYTPPGSLITIEGRVDDGAVRISVADQGPGIPAGRAEAIFEKFTRGDSESATPGVGLGLAICRAIVDAHGGRLWVEQTTGGGGAKFVFTLPRGKPPEIDPADTLAGATED